LLKQEELKSKKKGIQCNMEKDDKSNTESKPNFISKSEADKKNDFAQSLDDKITDVVDYGDLGDE
jgi:hypothetical protein